LVETSKRIATEEIFSHLGRAVRQQTRLASVHTTRKMCWAALYTTRKMSWAAATRSIRECKMRNGKIRGPRLDTDSEVWGLDQTTWELMWAGEAAMQKSISTLRQAGFESILDLPRIQKSCREKAFVVIPLVMRICATSNGEQRVQVFIPVVQ